MSSDFNVYEDLKRDMAWEAQNNESPRCKINIDISERRVLTKNKEGNIKQFLKMTLKFLHCCQNILNLYSRIKVSEYLSVRFNLIELQLVV